MTKNDRYTAAIREIKIRLEKGGDLIADLGNVTAVLKKRLDYFWVGFYLVRNEQLVLGPFQGPPACVYIQIGKGVCGACASKKEAMIISDVRKFSGHIVCDPNSLSEIVVPVFDKNRALRAVLDLDHTKINAFDEVDRMGLEAVSGLLEDRW